MLISLLVDLLRSIAQLHCRMIFFIDCHTQLANAEFADLRVFTSPAYRCDAASGYGILRCRRCIFQRRASIIIAMLYAIARVRASPAPSCLYRIPRRYGRAAAPQGACPSPRHSGRRRCRIEPILASAIFLCAYGYDYTRGRAHAHAYTRFYQQKYRRRTIKHDYTLFAHHARIPFVLSR